MQAVQAGVRSAAAAAAAKQVMQQRAAASGRTTLVAGSVGTGKTKWGGRQGLEDGRGQRSRGGLSTAGRVHARLLLSRLSLFPYPLNRPSGVLNMQSTAAT